jgi:hypothetical protein
MNRYDKVADKIRNTKGIQILLDEGIDFDILMSYVINEGMKLNDIPYYLTEVFEDWIMDNNSLTTKQKVMKLSRYYIIIA